MPNAYISGTGLCLPDRVVTNDDLVKEFGIDTSDEWIFQRTGIRERRFADQGVAASDLGAEASRVALERAGLAKRDVDMIVFCTLSPDHVFPGSGVYMQEKMGFCEDGHFVPALDIRNQCSGFLYGLATASSMVQAGGCKHVLVVGAEVHSHALDLTTRGRAVASLFGDAAGAVVVSATDEDRGVRGWYLGADGRFGDVLCQKVWDMTQRPYIPLDEDGVGRVQPEMLWAHMEGRLVFKNAVERMIESLMRAFQDQHLTLEDIDLFVFHQANLRINQFIQEQIGAPAEKFVNNIGRCGNTTAATIPTLLHEAEVGGKLTPGMKVAMVAFGSGFTWGSAIVDW